MPLPEKVIEQLEREPPKTPGWSGQLLVFSSTVFFLSLFIYFGLAYGYKSYLNSQVKKLQDQIQSFSEQIPLDEQNKIAGFYSQLANLKSLLAVHVDASPAFGWLEKNTQANVFYTSLALNTAANQLSLSGFAKSMDDVSQQVAIFENQPEIKSVKIGNVSIANSLWQFDANLVFNSGYFYGGAAQ